MESYNRVLHCPKCGYAITEYEHRMTTYDYPCPNRCEETTLSEFLTGAELLSEVANNHPEWFEDK